MKSVLSLIVLLLGAQAVAAPLKLLEYKFGNQQEESTLQIFSDGTITHGERTCCPTRTEQIPENKLSATQLSQLEADITAASKGALSARDGGDMKSNAKFGSLYVYKNSRQVIVLEVEALAGSVSVTTNHAREAASLIQLVSSFTKIDP